MIKAFLSHSSAQKPFVRKLAEEIGFDSCILDERTFESGKLILDEILTAIGSSGIFIFLISDEALKSNWVINEIAHVRELIDEGKLIHFRPYIIDDKISHEDSRIKPWIKKDYLLEQFSSPILLARKIKETIREVIWQKYPVLKEKDNLFLGRNLELQKIESKYYDGSTKSRRAIIVSGFPDGVGRRKLLTEFIIQKLTSNKTLSYNPIPIELSDGQSIEDFILQLNDCFLLYKSDDLLEKLHQSKQEKLKLAIELVNYMATKKERLLIRDNGVCVLSNGRLNSWFQELICSKELIPQIHFFIASKCYPRADIENIFPELISLQIYPLSKNDTKVMFYAYSDIIKLHLKEEESNYFINKFSGLPIQIFRGVELIKNSGVELAKKEIQPILETGDKSIISLIDIFKEQIEHIQTMILLSNFEFISYDLLKKISNEFIDVDDILQDFSLYSIYESFGSNNQYIRLNVTISDYINRSRLPLDSRYKTKLQELTKKFLVDSNNFELNDLSEFLYSVQEAIKTNVKNINEKYLIPSFFVKVIIEEYKNENDLNVVELSDKILYDNRKFYEEIVRSIRYWLCSSLCRLQDEERFFIEVDYFTGYTKAFLMGFYYRRAKKYQKSEKYYQQALDFMGKDNDYSAKAKHEMVIVKMKLNKYSEALDLARESYNHQRTNTFHIESYFRCLVRTNRPDKIILKQLIKELETSYDIKKDVIVATLNAEYKFFIEGNFPDAVTELRNLVETSPKYRNFPFRTLIEICNKRDANNITYDLREKYKKDLSQEEDVLNNFN